MKEYKVKFNKSDGTTEERKYTLINSSTVRARSLMMKFFNIDKNGNTEFDSEFFQSLYEEESVINDLMKSIAVGNHDDISWFDADSKTTDSILNDFFMSFLPKTKKSS